MKAMWITFLSGFVAAQAAVIPFDVSPPGSDAATGLSASNMSPPISSSGSGGEVMGGVSYDESTRTLNISLGYGSTAGFTNLTGPATMVEVRGPAGVGTNAGLIASITGMNFPAPDPSQGGVIVGKLVFPVQSTNEVADLLGGLYYITIGTSNHPYGEVRGQLIAQTVANPPPAVAFDVSPAGSDAAPGLSPLNMSPPISSTGSGGEVMDGVSYDESTRTLNISLGYGSASGFSDLSSPATSVEVRGPAGVGTNAGVIAAISAMNFPATDPSKGGVIIGKLVFPLQSTNEVADLLGGLYYITIGTATNPYGEVRGQLIAQAVSNMPPTLVCPADATVECSTPATLTAVVTDPEGDALAVVWAVNGTAVATNMLAAGEPGVAANVDFTATLPLGTNSISITVTDTAGNSVSCEAAVTVVDTTPPVIQSASATPGVIWPPNHKMVYVHVSAAVTDACSATTWKIISITCNERANGRGDGNTSADYAIVGDHAAKVRAERSGTGTGRIYTLTLQATDASGNLSETKSVEVCVPKSQGNPAKAATSASGNSTSSSKAGAPAVAKQSKPAPPTAKAEKLSKK